MRFTLTESQIAGIMFAMEDQNGEYYLDARDGTVVSAREPEHNHKNHIDDDDDRFLPLPVWDSAGGYRLREQFAGTCRNAEIRRRLLAALDQGKGVFRAFKDALAPYPEAEQRWYAFKERELRRRVRDWYNELRESWGLQRLGEEPEETGDLVLEDFRFRPPAEGDREAARELHRLCCAAAASAATVSAASERGSPPEPEVEVDPLLVVAESAGGELAGYGALRREEAAFRLCLEVAPEYRGIGLGEALLERSLEAAPAGQIILELPIASETFEKVLIRHDFGPIATTYSRNTREDAP
jgi:ribosomal protein S18 acetylase RimI-like enzyme